MSSVGVTLSVRSVRDSRRQLTDHWQQERNHDAPTRHDERDRAPSQQNRAEPGGGGYLTAAAGRNRPDRPKRHTSTGQTGEKHKHRTDRRDTQAPDRPEDKLTVAFTSPAGNCCWRARLVRAEWLKSARAGWKHESVWRHESVYYNIIIKYGIQSTRVTKFRITKIYWFIVLQN